MITTVFALGILLAPQTSTADLTKGRKLVFREEFRRAGLVNPKTWKYWVGRPHREEAQYYTDARKENARIENGNLILEARQDHYKGNEVTSASLTSRKSWKYGYFEVRAKVPSGKGTWPAAWFLGEAMRKKRPDYIPWPLCGEVDLMEHWGLAPKRLLFSVHCKDNDDKGTELNSDLYVDDAETAFHVYGLDWGPERMDFYFNGKKVYHYENDHKGKETWPFDEPMYLILNLAISGDWRAVQEPNDKLFPCRYLVDYVRIYQ